MQFFLSRPHQIQEKKRLLKEAQDKKKKGVAEGKIVSVSDFRRSNMCFVHMSQCVDLKP